LRHDHKPVIFLINNGGYTIERGYLGKTEPYNDIADWAYADLPKVARNTAITCSSGRPHNNGGVACRNLR
jgi:TPP-dependent 2-oxoacid decarboxylase